MDNNAYITAILSALPTVYKVVPYTTDGETTLRWAGKRGYVSITREGHRTRVSVVLDGIRYGHVYKTLAPTGTVSLALAKSIRVALSYVICD